MQPGITMVIRSLTGGGAELIMTLMGKYWAERGVNVTLITAAPISSDAYTLHPAIKRIDLALPKPNFFSQLGFPWDIKSLRSAIKQANNPIVLSFMERSNIPVILATRGLKSKVIVAERVDPRPQNRSFISRLLMRCTYPLADAITVQTENVKKDWAESFLPARKVHAIHNPVRSIDKEAPLPDWIPQRFICCMGRLHPQKGFDQLLTILPSILEQFPEYKVVVLGEGTYRKELEIQRDALGLKEKVLFPGFVKNPHILMKQADLFVFSSRYEGFPNALMEAMSLGLPVISFDCPSGPRYLIDHGTDGILIPANNLVLMQNSICAMLANKTLRNTLGQNAYKKIQANCALPKIMSIWEQLIDGLCTETLNDSIVTKVYALSSFKD